MEAFAWLGQLAETLGSLIPTWHHQEWQDVGVAIKRGRIIISLRPGIIWHWPFWTIIYSRAANKQTKDLKTQTLMTNDNIAVAAGCMVRYTIPRPWINEEAQRIENADIKALIETEDVDRAIEDETLAVLCEYVTGKSLQDINGNRKKVNTDLTLQVRSTLKQYGAYVERAQLTDFSEGTPLIHIGATLNTVAPESRD
ncbi:unnamed protein product [marine sediment metagenome]|uniref:Band 7 domain-containing protein n=1 Tax=marine sediment metagenome TaxID=412755 RepID=X0TD42_9ZZZZ